ncbi:MAG: FKBP-type peptidyl-prolyl cis-trans isomerase [Polyangiaceae bacterium]|jgi:FKBP-type peptidyl-prolyl cis-trans isomerase FkpA
MLRAFFHRAFLLSLGLGLAAPACKSHSDANAAASASASASAASTPPTPATVTTTILTPGTGPVAKAGDKVAVHYVGTLLDGSKFASSRDKNEPLIFVIGQRGIVKGLNQGVLGMKVGETRKVVVPPGLAYKERSNDKIPPNSTLIYEVELLGIESK